jgi:acyl carrier protein
MADATTLHQEIREILVDELMLDLTYEEIGADTPLMGPESLGLDSVDALQLVVAIEKHFGFKIKDAEAAQGILRSVNTIAEAIEKHRAESAA